MRLLALLILLLPTVVFGAQWQVKPSVIDMWDFNSNTLSAKRAEYLKGSHTMLYTTGVDGTANGALSFDKTRVALFNDYCQTTLAGASQYTIQFYGYMLDQTNFPSMIGYTPSRGFEITKRSDNANWIIWYGGFNDGAANIGAIQTWLRFTISYSGTMTKIWVNDTLFINYSSATNFLAGSNNVVLGAANAALGNAASCYIDKLVILNTAVSSGAEVSTTQVISDIIVP